MADINIENFYRHIAKILNILYIHFPTKAPIYVDEVAGIDEPDEYGLHSPTYMAGFYALIWLEEEGYLRYADTIRQDGIDQASLTHKALLKLTEVTDPIYIDTSAGGNASTVALLQPLETLSPSIIKERKKDGHKSAKSRAKKRLIHRDNQASQLYSAYLVNT